jgi:hypothetical protein
MGSGFACGPEPAGPSWLVADRRAAPGSRPDELGGHSESERDIPAA